MIRMTWRWGGGLALAAALALGGGEARAQRGTLPPGQAKKLEVYPWDAKAAKILLQDKDAKDREKAARQLGRGHNSKVIPILAHYAAYDSNLGVREACSAALHEIRTHRDGWQPPEYPEVDRGRGLVADKYADERDRVQEAWESLQQLKSDNKSFRREAAARTLGRIGGPRVLPALGHAAAYDPDSSVRNVASRSLERIKEREDGWRPPAPPPYQIAEVPYPEQGLPQFRPEPLDQNAELIQSCVQHYLSRIARPEEVRNWARHLERGGTYLQMLETILVSDEYFQRAGSDPATLVVRLYADVLRREANEEEIRVWLQRWETVRDRRQMIHDFLDASHREMRQRGLSY